MRKKIVMLALGFCLLAAACAGKEQKKDESDKITEEAVGKNEEQKKDNKTKKQEETQKDKDASKDKKKDKKDQASSEQEMEEQGKELTKVPEVTFTDYSQDIQDPDTGALLLAVTENCPVISIPENEAVAERMNMVFQELHENNQAIIQEDIVDAKDAYQALSEEELASWSGYGYGLSYKVMYASTRILSIEAESYEWQGSASPNTWSSSYCFDVTNGTLLYLADIFTDKAEAGKIVEKHILDTITKEPYKDALMEDYESYVSDILTEDVFYLNEKGLVVICNPNMVTIGAAGVIEIEIPYKELKDVMNERYVL
ncbi:DUF3298 domain-containing protein [Lachnospiraceae bacterium 66-29]